MPMNRLETMLRIRNRNTGAELATRRVLHAASLRYGPHRLSPAFTNISVTAAREARATISVMLCVTGVTPPPARPRPPQPPRRAVGWGEADNRHRQPRALRRSAVRNASLLGAACSRSYRGPRTRPSWEEIPTCD